MLGIGEKDLGSKLMEVLQLKGCPVGFLLFGAVMETVLCWVSPGLWHCHVGCRGVSKTQYTLLDIPSCNPQQCVPSFASTLFIWKEIIPGNVPVYISKR